MNSHRPTFGYVDDLILTCSNDLMAVLLADLRTLLTYSVWRTLLVGLARR